MDINRVLSILQQSPFGRSFAGIITDIAGRMDLQVMRVVTTFLNGLSRLGLVERVVNAEDDVLVYTAIPDHSLQGYLIAFPICLQLSPYVVFFHSYPAASAWIVTRLPTCYTSNAQSCFPLRFWNITPLLSLLTFKNVISSEK